MPLAAKTPTVRIALTKRMVELPESEKAMKIWRPGETLEGFLEVVSAFSLEMDEVSVSFQGVSRVWNPNEHANRPAIRFAERKFLDQKYHIPVDECEEEPTIAGYTHFLPFQFIIPYSAVTPDLDVHPLCRILPPSITEGKIHIQRSTNQIFAQPYISYSISALVRCHRNEHLSVPRSCFDVQAEQVVAVLPFTSPELVASSEYKLTEFKSSSRRDIKIFHWFNRQLAEVEVSMMEPPTLAYGGHVPHVRSRALIHLRLRFQGFRDSRKGPNISSCSVSSRIKIETICSTDDLPTASLTTNTANPSKTYSRAASIQLPRCKNKISWSSVSDPMRSESLQNFDSVQIWTTSTTIPIQPPKALPPSFCSTLAARKYSLRTYLKLGRAHHKVFELETPLRVTYPGPQCTTFDYTETAVNKSSHEQIQRQHIFLE